MQIQNTRFGVSTQQGQKTQPQYSGNASRRLEEEVVRDETHHESAMVKNIAKGAGLLTLVAGTFVGARAGYQGLGVQISKVAATASKILENTTPKKQGTARWLGSWVWGIYKVVGSVLSPFAMVRVLYAKGLCFSR